MPKAKAATIIATSEESGAEEAEDSFVLLLKSEIEALLKQPLEPKEKNAVRNKAGGDDGSFWSD
jgi:hypothetical protein